MENRVADIDFAPISALSPLDGLFARCRERTGYKSITLSEALAPIYEMCLTTDTGININIIKI